MNRLIQLICVAIIAAFTLSANASQYSSRKSELRSIINKISLIKNKLFSVKSKRDILRDDLQQSEMAIGSVANQIRSTKIKIAHRKKLIKKSITRRGKYHRLLESQKKLLAKQARAYYMLGQQPYLKILLNQEDPEKLSRFLTYYEYISQERLNIINHIKHTIQYIHETTEAINQETKLLRNVYANLQKQKYHQQNEQLHRRHLLTKINRQIYTEKEKLQKLYSDKTRLENVVKTLVRQRSFGYVPGTTFKQMHKKLHWPVVNGKVVQYFGQALYHNRLHSTGLLIDANAGTKIHSVFPGKIVFANWLRGFGLLVIVLHGQNYMTLYGHNQSLFVKTGDNVKAGQIIATVGNSGGFQKNALYFEIRHNGIPVNPLSWLR